MSKLNTLIFFLNLGFQLVEMDFAGLLHWGQNKFSTLNYQLSMVGLWTRTVLVSGPYSGSHLINVLRVMLPFVRAPTGTRGGNRNPLPCMSSGASR